MPEQIAISSFPKKAQQLVETCHSLANQNLAPATGGNFSVRVNEKHCMITQSGCDKSQLTIENLMLCDLANKPLDATLRPSAELGLHTTLYKLDGEIGAVLHTHSIISTVLSRAITDDLLLRGFEMQKALSGNVTHDQEIIIATFNNNQDISELASNLEKRWHAGEITQPGFLVRGHGLYAWGTNLQEAKRHVEGLEFLFACAWQEKLRERP